MPEYIPDFGGPLVIGARGLPAILQNIRVIIQTTAFSVPLDRAFANGASYIDAPAPVVAARKAGELWDALEKYEPRIEVDSIDFGEGDLMEGALSPKIVFHLREGASL